MDSSFDHYQLLHVQPDAPEAVIKASYRAMMQKLRHHPDLGGDLAMAQRLNEALDTLCDAQRRACYDRQLRNAAPEATPDTAPDAASRAATPEAARSPESGAKDQTPDHIRLPRHPRCPFCLANYPGRSVGGCAGRSRAGGAGTVVSAQAYAGSNLCHQCQGPVTPVERLDPASEAELRGIYRHDCSAAVILWDSWPLKTGIRATLSDLSINGCAVLSERALSLDRNILLRTDALVAIAQVRYCRQSSDQNAFCVGLEFLTIHVQARPGAVFSATA